MTHEARQIFQVFPSSGVPIYRQLIDQVEAQVAGGRLLPGDFLPSVRQVAEQVSVNPMTVSKAYSQLELGGIVERVRGTGMRVTAPSPRGTRSQRMHDLLPYLEQVVGRAHQLSLSKDEVIECLSNLMETSEDE